ncbi:hypothetical protein NUU61_001813 [Penicillium alfredii]|uniref:DNA-directed RNA polymerase III subunit n=1 Tax=Penicillium alfredii TaxID=1506179 RepID=A0A9W9FQA7_9EURO|nr:uncharacterized protein NUU61_001813 [Penicillium alfredii]KAJ5104466.1 hypothetical protein NUU61_001813 [Penicillium alfredii]
MSRAGAKKGRRMPGAEFSWDADPGGEPDTAPTPLYPKYVVPLARKLNPREQSQVDYYRGLRERFHEGPYYSVLDASSSTAKKGSAARVNFDPFHGMPTYSGRYQKKRRTLPKISGQSYHLNFFPREFWQTLQPNFRPGGMMDGYEAQMPRAGVKRGFEDEEDEAEDDAAKRRAAGGEEDEGEGEVDADEGELLEGEEDQEEEIVDDDFEDDDDEMGGDYNAEQYFDGGDDDFGDDDGGGGDEDTY